MTFDPKRLEEIRLNHSGCEAPAMCTVCGLLSAVDELRVELRELSAKRAIEACESDGLKVAIDLVSGALCDASDIPVPTDVLKYGDAVRELTAKRDSLAARAKELEAALRLQVVIDAAADGEICFCSDSSGFRDPPRHWPGCVQARAALQKGKA